jgi:hypothetical protein
MINCTTRPTVSSQLRLIKNTVLCTFSRSVELRDVQGNVMSDEEGKSILHTEFWEKFIKEVDENLVSIVYLIARFVGKDGTPQLLPD